MQALLVQMDAKRVSSLVVESRSGIASVFRERDRHGNIVYYVRLAIGDLTPWKFGPFDSKEDAVSVMNRLGELVETAIGDIPADIVSHAHCEFSQEI